MIASSIFVSRLLPGDVSGRSFLGHGLSQGFGGFLELATLQQDREREREFLLDSTTSRKWRKTMMPRATMRTRGGSSGLTERQLQQHSSVVRWIWREKKNELREESEEGREGHTHTCHRHDFMESLHQVRSRRMGSASET
jgi:hypothetical protein